MVLKPSRKVGGFAPHLFRWLSSSPGPPRPRKRPIFNQIQNPPLLNPPLATAYFVFVRFRVLYGSLWGMFQLAVEVRLRRFVFQFAAEYSFLSVDGAWTSPQMYAVIRKLSQHLVWPLCGKSERERYFLRGWQGHGPGEEETLERLFKMLKRWVLYRCDQTRNERPAEPPPRTCLSIGFRVSFFVQIDVRGGGGRSHFSGGPRDPNRHHPIEFSFVSNLVHPSQRGQTTRRQHAEATRFQLTNSRSHMCKWGHG